MRQLLSNNQRAPTASTHRCHAMPLPRQRTIQQLDLDVASSTSTLLDLAPLLHDSERYACMVAKGRYKIASLGVSCPGGTHLDSFTLPHLQQGIRAVVLHPGWSSYCVFVVRPDTHSAAQPASGSGGSNQGGGEEADSWRWVAQVLHQAARPNDLKVAALPARAVPLFTNVLDAAGYRKANDTPCFRFVMMGQLSPAARAMLCTRPTRIELLEESPQGETTTSTTTNNNNSTNSTTNTTSTSSSITTTNSTTNGTSSSSGSQVAGPNQGARTVAYTLDLGPLLLQDADIVNDHWTYKSSISLELIRQTIQENRTACIRLMPATSNPRSGQADHTAPTGVAVAPTLSPALPAPCIAPGTTGHSLPPPIAWVLHGSYDGTIGMSHTRAPYRRMGVMSVCVAEVTRLMLEEDHVGQVVGHVVHGNEASASMMRRLGFEEAGEADHCLSYVQTPVGSQKSRL